MTPLGGRKTKSDFRNEKYRIDYPYHAETTREMALFCTQTGLRVQAPERANLPQSRPSL